MSVARPDFLDAYTAVEVPAPMRSMDAIDEQVAEVSNTFFDEIRDSLDLSYRSLQHLFEIEHKMLVPPYPRGTAPEHTVRASDDYLKVFQRRGGQALASVLYMRDDANFQIAHFSKFSLLPQTEEEIRAFQHMERIEIGLE